MQLKINPLTTELAFLSDDKTKEFISIAYDKVREYDGVKPSSIYVTPVKRKTEYGGWDTDDALIASWGPVRISRSAADNLESLMEEIYDPKSIHTRRDKRGRPVRPINYRSPENHERPSARGYVFTTNVNRMMGLLLMRQFNSANQARKLVSADRGNWLYNGEGFAELRLNLGFTNLTALESIVRASCYLNNNPPKDNKGLIYDLYKTLMLTNIDKRKFDELVGIDDIIDFMRWTMFAASEIPVASIYGLKNRSVLLAGVYGVGKSSIAAVLASENNGTLFVPIETPSLVTTMGEKKEEETDLFSIVKGLQKRTGVNVALFCDDIESAMLSSEYIQMPEYLARTSALLNKLQGVGSGNFLLSGSTNNPFVMDPRFLEFGRIGYVIHVPLPDEKNRKETFLVHTRGRHMASIDFSSLAAQTEGLSNRHIEEICRGAGESAVKRAGASIRKAGESLFEATKRVTPDVAKDFPINPDDFAVGLEIVRKYVRIKEIKDLDANIAKFCKSYSREIAPFGLPLR